MFRESKNYIHRYPNLDFLVPEEKASEALHKAREIVDFVLSKINEKSS